MWIFFAGLSALAVSSRTLFTKKLLNEDMGAFFTAWITVFVAFILSGVLVLLNGLVLPEQNFWGILAIRLVLDVIALMTFIYALKQKAVSFVVPLLTLTPVLTLVTGFFLAEQIPTFYGILSVLVIVSGSILVVLSEVNYKDFSANKSLLKALGLIGVTVICWAFLDSIHKLAIDASDTFTYLFYGNVAFSVIFLLPALIWNRTDMKRFVKFEISPWVLLLGVFLIVEFGSQLIAIETGLIAYVSAIKASNVAFTTLAGIILLKERPGLFKVLIRILGMLLAVAGVVLLIFLG